MRRWFGGSRWMVALACAAALVFGTVGLGSVGAFVRFDVAGASSASTSTTSTKHVTTLSRVDLEAAPALGCDDPGSAPVLVDETTTVLDPKIDSTLTVGPADILVGEDQLTPFHVAAGSTNIDILTTYESVVTQRFQAVAPGPPCAVAAAAVVASAVGFTG